VVAKLIGVALYLLALVMIGVVASRRMKDLRDYFAGGKNLGFLAVAFSARATGESAWLLLGLTGMGAAIGAKAFWVVLGETLGVAGAWFLMSRRFWRLTQRYDSITVPDYLESRFRDSAQTLRKVAAGALVIFIAIYVSAQIDATGKAFEGFLGWNYYVGALTGFAVVMVYITTGGFVAVVWSDVFQGTLMVAGLALLPVVGLISAGGWSEVANTLRASDASLLRFMGAEGFTLMGVFSVLGLALIGIGFMGSPQIFVRFLALRDESEISRGAALAIVWTLIADGGAVLIGMVGRALLVGVDGSVEAALGDAERVLPLLVEHLLPMFLVGLYIAIVLSAIMSTVDSLLVLASSAAVRDFYQKIKNPDLPDDQLVRTSRIATAALALAGLGIALVVAVTTPDRTVFWFVIFGWSGISATFCPTMILSLFWRGMTAKGALASMITGFLCVPLFKFVLMKLDGVGPYLVELSELPPAFGLAFLAGVLVSLADKRGQQALADIGAELDDAAR
jgi:sodium/proline symporter